MLMAETQSAAANFIKVWLCGSFEATLRKLWEIFCGSLLSRSFYEISGCEQATPVAEETNQCGKFVSRGGYLRRTILMLSIYLLLNFLNLRHAISKLSSLGD
jgi:hypothetical protein